MLNFFRMIAARRIPLTTLALCLLLTALVVLGIEDRRMLESFLVGLFALDEDMVLDGLFVANAFLISLLAFRIFPPLPDGLGVALATLAMASILAESPILAALTLTASVLFGREARRSAQARQPIEITARGAGSQTRI
jgi:hypothetical protein